METTRTDEKSSRAAEFEPIIDEVLAIQARQKHRAKDRSLVTLTYAQGLDGSIAAGKGGAPLRLSSRATMLMTHRLRALHDGILVGINTVLSDDPSLNTRLCTGPSPRPIILDSELKCPPQAKLIQLRKLAGEPGAILVYQEKRMRCADPAQGLERSRRKVALEAEGAVVVPAPGDWQALFTLLKRDFGLKSVMIEGGARVIRSALTDGKDVIDAVAITVAPVFVGGLVPSQPWDGTHAHTRLEIHKAILVEGDLVLCATLGS